MENKFLSRKFIITTVILVSTTALAYFGKMNGDVALVFGACVASYNYANFKSKGEISE
jgi:hypothetical protein